MRHLCLFLDQFSRKNMWPHETSTKKTLQTLHPEALNFWISEHLVRKLNGGTCWIINKPKHLKTSNGPPLVAQLTASRPKSTMVLMGWIPNSVTVFKGSGHCKLVLPKLKSINLMVLPIKLTWPGFLSQKACNKKIAVWHRLSQLKHEHRPFHPSSEVLRKSIVSTRSLKDQRPVRRYVCIEPMFHTFDTSTTLDMESSKPHISGDQSSRKVRWNPLTRKACQTQDIRHSTLESWVKQPGMGEATTPFETKNGSNHLKPMAHVSM